MTFLLDINVLMALAWPTHVSHAKATAWLKDKLAKNKQVVLATCPITEIGFCRVSMNVKAYAANLHSTATLLQSLVNGKEFTTKLIPDSLGITDWALKRIDQPGASKLTDIYLAELAYKNNATLVTFDRGISGPAVELIE